MRGCHITTALLLGLSQNSAPRGGGGYYLGYVTKKYWQTRDIQPILV